MRPRALWALVRRLGSHTLLVRAQGQVSQEVPAGPVFGLGLGGRHVILGPLAPLQSPVNLSKNKREGNEEPHRLYWDIAWEPRGRPGPNSQLCHLQAV